MTDKRYVEKRVTTKADPFMSPSGTRGGMIPTLIRSLCLILARQGWYEGWKESSRD